MLNYLISFPSGVMQIPEGEFDTVVRESHEVVQQLKDAGAYRFGGGINEDVAPVVVAADGTVSTDVYPRTRYLDGGFLVIQVESRAEAESWAAKVAASCRCPQELLEFWFDPES